MRRGVWLALALLVPGGCSAQGGAGPDAGVAPDGGGAAEPAGPACAVVSYPEAEAGAEVCSFYACADGWIAGGACAPGDYVMGFACKYADLYLAEVYADLGPGGQAFLEGAFVCLQEALEPYLESEEASAATTCEAIAEAGFGAHVPCYMAHGFCDLPSEDILAIAAAIDDEDLDNPLQQAAMLDILGRCAARPAAAAPSLVVATQNAGTTPFMDLLVPSPLRETCESWYDNNLCTLASEAHLGEALVELQPDLLFLQEVWEQGGCADPDRPGEVNDAPFACGAGAGSQLGRVLPAGDYRWACADGYPDNCVAFRAGALEPAGGACLARDCSAAMVSVEAACGEPGRIAYLRGDTAEGPLTAVVVHTHAGIDAADAQCRRDQLDALRQVLVGEVPAGERVVVAGDFNLDPSEHTGVDVDAFVALLDAVGLAALASAGPSHRILGQTLDLVLVRGFAAAQGEPCAVALVDEGDPLPMFDHALVWCEVVEE